MHKPTDSMQDWLATARKHFSDNAPALLFLFDIYAAEATFGRSFIAADLAALKPGAKVLEIGAGSLLLSCNLVREGFNVTGIEPIGTGFSHFEQMRKIVLDIATATNCVPRILDMTAEELTETDRFEYAFSVNVMEHVNDVDLVVATVSRSLKEQACYHFTCPNYYFPYEPHFNMLTLFSKSLTFRLFKNRILGSKNMADPAGAWQSLNWINVQQIARAVAQHPGFRVTFNRRLLVSTLERVATDPDFASRRSPLMRRLLSMLVRTGLHRTLSWMPATVQPIIDCKIQKTSGSKDF